MFNITFIKYDNGQIELEQYEGIFFIDVTDNPNTDTVNKENLVIDKYKISNNTYLVKHDFFLNITRDIAEDQRINVVYFKYKNSHIYIVPNDTNVTYKNI